ncbi:hypothetical protein HDE_01982 [Halotydeus destructor]|nr:hypothetical protein HDE_01982 [Halotydeus destructor]
MHCWSVLIALLISVTSAHAGSKVEPVVYTGPPGQSGNLKWAEDGTPIIPDNIVDVYSDPSLTVGEKWAIIGHFYNDFAWPHRRTIIDYVGRALAEKKLKLNADCKRSLQLFKTGLEESTLWAFEVMDSMAKMRPGFLSGEYGDFGKWDECIEVNYDDNQLKFGGQYCLYQMHFPQPVDKAEAVKLLDHFNGTWMEDIVRHNELFRVVPVTNSLCFPSVCSRTEIQSAIQYYLDQAEVPVEFKFHETCETIERYSLPFSSLPSWKQAAIVVFLTIAILVTVTTLISHNLPDSLPKWLRHWDAKRNTARIFADIDDDNEKEVKFYHCEMVNKTVLFFFANITFMSGIYSPETHYTLLNFDTPEVHPFLGGLLSFNHLAEFTGFFTVNALVAYKFFHVAMEKNGAVSILSYIRHKVVNTMPAILGALLVVFAFPPNWGAGPLFLRGYTNITENCLANWWSEITYNGNNVKATEMCLPHAWIVSADMKLYAGTFLIMLALNKVPSIGITMCLAAILTGILTEVTNMTKYTGHHWVFSSGNIFDIINQLPVTQFATSNYLSSYAIGLLAGYCIANKIKPSRVQYLALWALVGAIFSAYATYAFMGLSDQLSKQQRVVIGCTIRTAFSLVVSWMFYNMWLTRNKLVGRFTNANFFLYFGRLNYSMYTVHFLFTLYHNFSQRQPIEYRGFPLAMRLISQLAVSYFLGYILYLMFEGPAASLFKVASSSPKVQANGSKDESKKVN